MLRRAMMAQQDEDALFDGMRTLEAVVSGRELTRNPGSNNAIAFSATHVTGRKYVEMIVSRTSGQAGLALYNGGLTDISGLSANAPGLWWGQPGMHVVLLGWSTAINSNINLPTQFNHSTSHSAAQTTQRFAIAVDAEGPGGPKVWVRTPSVPPPGVATWVGGGDPATDATPTLLMGGTGALLVGGTLSTAGNSVEWVLPDDQLWPAPAGFDPM